MAYAPPCLKSRQSVLGAKTLDIQWEWSKASEKTYSVPYELIGLSSVASHFIGVFRFCRYFRNSQGDFSDLVRLNSRYFSPDYGSAPNFSEN